MKYKIKVLVILFIFIGGMAALWAYPNIVAASNRRTADELLPKITKAASALCSSAGSEMESVEFSPAGSRSKYTYNLVLTCSGGLISKYRKYTLLDELYDIEPIKYESVYVKMIYDGKEYYLDSKYYGDLYCGGKMIYDGFDFSNDRYRYEELKAEPAVPDMPYVGMPTSKISDTKLGPPDKYEKFGSDDSEVFVVGYHWYNADGSLRCYATATNWNGRRIVMPFVDSVNGSSSGGSCYSSSDYYDAGDYWNAEDFYTDHEDEFEDYEDAEDYWEENGGQ